MVCQMAVLKGVLDGFMSGLIGFRGGELDAFRRF